MCGYVLNERVVGGGGGKQLYLNVCSHKHVPPQQKERRNPAEEKPPRKWQDNRRKPWLPSTERLLTKVASLDFNRSLLEELEDVT